VRVETTITNAGKVPITVRHALFRIQQVSPLADEVLASVEASADPVPEGEPEINWPGLGEREYEKDRVLVEVEPGESDVVTTDFVIESDVETVQVYSFLWNVTKTDIGWGLTTI
jgi:hypothetical protein